MRRFALFFLFIRLPLDYLAVVLAGIVSYFLRFGTLADWRPAQQLIPFHRYTTIVFTLAVLWIISFAFAGLYRVRRQRLVDEFVRLFMASSATIMAVVILIFLRRDFFASRFIVLVAWLLTFLFVFIERTAVRLLELHLLSSGYGRHRIVVIGEGESATAVIKATKDEPGLALHVVAHFSHFDSRAETALRRHRETGGLDEIVVVNTAVSKEEAARILRFIDDTQVSLRYSADLFAARRVSLEFMNIAGVPLMEIKHTPLEGWGKIYKRIFDILVSLFFLVLTSPIMLVIAVCIKLTSRGPIFFIRERVGEYGVLFPFFKFRSMKVNAPHDIESRKKMSARPGIIPKMKENSSWITPVGRFIRRYSLDELPQFLNILLGHMSLVGPRPHLPDEVAGYDTWQKKLLRVKPGLTGLAQISGRADLAFADEARLDLWYIEHWSPRLDFAILLRTPVVVLAKKGAK